MLCGEIRNLVRVSSPKTSSKDISFRISSLSPIANPHLQYVMYGVCVCAGEREREREREGGGCNITQQHTGGIFAAAS